MTRLFGAAISALIFVPVSASAEPPIDCDNAMSTAEMNTCAAQDFEQADAALNQIYKEAIAAVPSLATGESPFDAKSWEEALRSAQRAWIAYRDAECRRHVPMFWTGGTGTTADEIGCMTRLTKQRTLELEERYRDGDPE